MDSGVEQNLSLYEDKLQFYLVYSPDDSQLSSHMQFAREVFATHNMFFSSDFFSRKFSLI